MGTMVIRDLTIDVERASRRVFFGVSALVFVTSAAATAVLCASMSSMGEMQMPGGWTMSMLWMRMPGQTWSAVAAAFVGMWTVMMVAMMLPSLAPMLWRYRESAAEARVAHPQRLTALVGLGYFVVWAALGFVVFLVGAALAAAALQQPALARAVPVVGGAVVLIAGALQFTSWKARHLAFCRDVHGRDASSGTAPMSGERGHPGSSSKPWNLEFGPPSRCRKVP